MAEKTETTILDEGAVSEIEAGARLDQCLKVVSSAVPNCFCRRPAGHPGAHSEPVQPDDMFWIHPAIPALCATVKHLRAEADGHLRRIAKFNDLNQTCSERLAAAIQESEDLQSQLEQLRAENETLKLSKDEVKVLTDYHYYEAEKDITRRGDSASQRQHLERLTALRGLKVIWP